MFLAGFSDAILRFIAERGDGPGAVAYVNGIDRSMQLEQQLLKRQAEKSKRLRKSTIKPVVFKKRCLLRSTSTSVPAPAIVEDASPGEDQIPPGLCHLPTAAGEFRTVRVFISSTFRDTQGERDVLTKLVFPELRRRARQLKLHVREVSCQDHARARHTRD